MNRHTILRLVAPVLTFAALVGAACVPDPAPGTTTTTTTAPASENQVALASAASWLAEQFDASGHLPHVLDPAVYDAGNAVLAVATLASLDVVEPGASARLASLQANLEDYLDEGAGDRPGALARVILAAVAVGEDPRAFAGTDLVARLEATLQPSGLFGSQYAGFDGAFRQGLALAALSVVTPRPATITPAPAQEVEDLAAVAWLLDQQCDDGSWLMFRASTVGDCVETPALGAYKDSNGSALATLGLAAVGASAGVDPALWFDAVRGTDGGWGASPSGPTVASDADSTGLVIAALEALGQTPDESAYAALRSFQLGDAAPPVGRGAFVWKLPSSEPNRLATLDAVVALYDEVWPAALVP